MQVYGLRGLGGELKRMEWELWGENDGKGDSEGSRHGSLSNSDGIKGIVFFVFILVVNLF